MPLPNQLKSFITSPENMNRRQELMRRFSVPFDKAIIITKTINKLLNKEIGLNDLVDTLQKGTGLPTDTVKKIVLEFAGYEFLPISDYLGDVDSFIRSLDGTPSAYPSQRITVREITPPDLVTEYLHEHPVNVPARLEHRLREILESRARNVRKDDETIARLTRAEKIGGVELPREEAEQLVIAFAAKVASVKIAPDNEPTPVAVTPAPPVIPTEAKMPNRSEASPSLAIEVSPHAEVSPRSSTKSGHGFTPQDEHEANIIRETVLPKMVSSAVFDIEEEIKRAVSRVFDATEIPLSVPLEERYKAVVTSRLKGVRDAAETRDILVRETAKGGLGFSSSDADKATVLIEGAMNSISVKREQAAKSEKTAFVKNSIDATFAKDESRKKGELEELDRMYSSLTGKVSKTPTPVAPPPVVMAPVPVPPRIPAPTVVNTQSPITKTQAVSTPSSVPPAAPTIPKPKPTITPPSPTPIRAPIPAPTVTQPVPRVQPIMPPLPTVALPRVAPSPKMQDVRPAPSNPQPTTSNSLAARLTGPVQELANLTLSDFRRLSADPVEACRKISDKLEILEEHAYTQRIAGIRAWQGSEVYKRYLDVINAAFSGGKPIAAAIAETIAMGRETPTEREVRAIMELNRQLKA
jgi:hypothetical protein